MAKEILFPGPRRERTVHRPTSQGLHLDIPEGMPLEGAVGSLRRGLPATAPQLWRETRPGPVLGRKCGCRPRAGWDGLGAVAAGLAVGVRIRDALT